MQGPHCIQLNFLGTGRWGSPARQSGQLFTGRTAAPASPTPSRPVPGLPWVQVRWPRGAAHCSLSSFLLTSGPAKTSERALLPQTQRELASFPSLPLSFIVDSLKYAAISSPPPPSLVGTGSAPGSKTSALDRACWWLQAGNSPQNLSWPD